MRNNSKKKKDDDDDKDDDGENEDLDCPEVDPTDEARVSFTVYGERPGENDTASTFYLDRFDLQPL